MELKDWIDFARYVEDFQKKHDCHICGSKDGQISAFLNGEDASTWRYGLFTSDKNKPPKISVSVGFHYFESDWNPSE